MKEFLSDKYIGWPYKKNGKDENGISCLYLTLKYLTDQGYKVKPPDKLPDRKKATIEDVKPYLEFFDLKNIQINDVLFFKWHNQIHSGVYIGDHQFLHASKSGSVVSKITSEIRRKFIGGIHPSKKKLKIIPYSKPPVAAIAVVAATTLFVTATAATMWAAVAYFAMGALTIAAMLTQRQPELNLDTEPQSPKYRFGPLRNTRSNEIVVPLIYGKNWVAGNIVYSSPTEEKKTIHQLIGLGEGEIQSIDRVLANDNELGTSGSVTDEDMTEEQPKYKHLTSHGSVDPDSFVLKNKATGAVIPKAGYFFNAKTGTVIAIPGFPLYTPLPVETTASYDYIALPDCSYTAYTGTSTQTVDSRAGDNVVGLRHLAYLACTFVASEQLNSLPTVKALVRGLKISTWDGNVWTSAETYSTNPAACIRDYLLKDKQVGGCGYSTSQVDDESFGSVYEYCDEVVNDGTGSGETEKRFEFNYVIDTYNTALDNLRTMLMVFGGYLIPSGGQLKLGVRKSKASIQAFDMSNIKEKTFSYGYIPKGTQYNRIGIQFIDLAQSDIKPVAWVDDRVDQDERGVVEKIIPVYGINKFSQANRLAWQTLYDTKINPIICSLVTDLEGVACEPGDVVTVSHDVPNWTDKRFLIATSEELSNDEIKLQMVAYNPTIFSDTYGSEITIYDYGSPPNPWVPCDEVTNLRVEEFGYTNDDGVRMSTLDIDFDAPDERYFLSRYLIQIKKDAEDYKDLTSIVETSYRTPSLSVGSTYTVRVKTVTIKGVQSSGSVAVATTIIGKDDPPSDVTAFICIRYRDSLKFIWTEVTDIDVRFYQIRRGTTWDSAVILKAKTTGEEWTSSDITKGTHSYWIKAIDNSGNLSENAKEATLAIDEIPFQNIILESAEDPDWDGTKSNTEISGNNLILSSGETSGTYTTPIQDLGILCWAKIYIKVVAAINQALKCNSDATRKFDDDPVLRFIGFPVETGWIIFEVRTSEDNVDWTDWGTWSQGDFKCRYYQVKMTVTRETTDIPVTVYNLTTGGDVPDVDEFGSGTITDAAAGITITFSKTFHAIPSMSVTPLGATAIYYQFTSVPSTTGCVFKLFNISGTHVAEAFSYQLHGY